MKRRQFIVGATSSAGLLLLEQSLAARPCPPVLSGAGAGSVCAPADLEADWQARINSPGVVWYHDFRNKAEVDQFRWTSGIQNDPNDADIGDDAGSVNWQTADGITGGACLETLRRAGTNDGGQWWRPFSPMSSGNGRGAPDPAASGTIGTSIWSPTQGGNQTSGWDFGFYGHPDYQGSVFDGHDYWIQARVKMHPNRAQEPGGGKLFYFTRTDRSLTSQEIVTKSHHDGVTAGEGTFFVYRGGGTALSSDPPNEVQPGRESNLYTTSNHNGYWIWPYGQWVTVLYHVRNGLNSNTDTLFQVWVDWDGTQKVDSFIKIWDQPTVDLSFDSAFPFGHNALIASGYMNKASFSQDIWQRYDQIIFSTQPIACPQI